MDERTLIFILLWTLGVVAGFWMVRRGHDPRWIYLGALLGPIFVPIAVERVRNHPTVVGDEPAARGNGGLRVLVGFDGSPESHEAVATVHRLFDPRTTTLVLAQVVSYDAAEDTSHSEVDDARRRLAEAVVELGAPEASFEVLAGPPAETLCTLAREQDMDLLVVGRRGRWLSQRVMGSVAERVVKNAHLPVLVAQTPGTRPAQPPDKIRNEAI
ncbi:MAG TPA: universal stress protein [Coriobacteriia bacterium]|nr:universal stress protein [Coriobacteriia bacterium]